MVTGALTGKAGAVTGPTGIDEVTEWSCDLTGELVDATSMSSAGYREHIIGLLSGEGSFTAIGDDVATGSVSSLALKTTTASGGIIISGPAIIETVGYAVSVGDRIEYGVSFKYTGAFTIGTVT